MSNWLTAPSQATKRVLFIRHGEYTCNVLKTINGDPRIPYPLTDRGHSQAQLASQALANRGIEAIICSEYLRARQTASHIADRLGLPVLVNRLANEVKSSPATEGRIATAFNELIAHDPVNTRVGHGAESFADVQNRLTQLLSDILLSSPSTVLVVSHGWVLQAVRVWQGDISVEEGARCVGMPANCEVVEVSFNAKELLSLTSKG